MNYRLAGTYKLPEEARKYFKEPLGTLYRNEEAITKFIEGLKKSKNTKIVTVGDATTKKLLQHIVFPNIAIIDELEKRQKVNKIDTSQFEVFEAKNPAGYITLEVWGLIRKVMKIGNIKIIIKIIGEEDLTVLPAVLEAPKNTIILYGQPNEGLVVVRVNEEKKEEVKRLLTKMVRIDGL